MKELKEYEKPRMDITYIDWADIVTSSKNTPEVVTPNIDVTSNIIDSDDPT